MSANCFLTASITVSLDWCWSSPWAARTRLMVKRTCIMAPFLTEIRGQQGVFLWWTQPCLYFSPQGPWKVWIWATVMFKCWITYLTSHMTEVWKEFNDSRHAFGWNYPNAHSLLDSETIIWPKLWVLWCLTTDPRTFTLTLEWMWSLPVSLRSLPAKKKNPTIFHPLKSEYGLPTNTLSSD